MSPLEIFIAAYIVVMNVCGFAAMGIDKSRARRGEWRISERALFLFALLGGSLGTTAGMYVFHHKTKHWYFVLFMPLILLLEAGLAAYLLLK